MRGSDEHTADDGGPIDGQAFVDWLAREASYFVGSSASSFSNGVSAMRAALKHIPVSYTHLTLPTKA